MGRPVWDDHHQGWVDAEGGLAIPVRIVLATDGPWWYTDDHKQLWRMTPYDDGEWHPASHVGAGILFDTDDDGNAAIYRLPNPKCDCGALKARTTHADWCCTQGGAG